MKKQLIFLMVTSALTFFVSCQEDEAEAEQMKEETPDEKAEAARNLMQSTASEMSQDVITLINTEGVEALMALINLMNDSDFDGRLDAGLKDETKLSVKRKVGLLYQQFVSGTIGHLSIAQEVEDGFDALKGIYEWNADTEEFERTGDSDFIEFRFPTAGSTTNNATLRLLELQFVEITEQDEFETYTYEMPTVIKADLSVEADKVVDLSVAVTYDAVGFPTSADVYLEVVPFSFTLQFDDREAMSSSASVAVQLNQETIVAATINVDYISTEKKALSALEGAVQYREMRLAGNIDIASLDASEDGNPNDYIELALYQGEEKLGDIVFVEEEDDEGYSDFVPYLVYEDGTRDKLEDVLQPVIDEVESFFEDLDAA